MGDIIVSSLVGGVGYVEGDAYIGAEEQYAEVVAEADAGAQGYVVGEGKMQMNGPNPAQFVGMYAPKMVASLGEIAALLQE